jgi:glycosyltransferase involved in cell wall biosynthesis
MISIIIPIAPNEESNWKSLVDDIDGNKCHDISEIILVSGDKLTLANKPNISISIIQKDNISRAGALNIGAKEAKGEFLWFLHSDSKLDHNTIEKLHKSIKENPSNLHYCDLAFYGTLSLMKINSFFVGIRCKLLSIPFGDQGFCVKKTIFNSLGGFSDKSSYGEDHLFIWKAKKANIRISSIKAKLFTSDRKYEDGGWLKITFLHQYLWWKQLIPQYSKNKSKAIGLTAGIITSILGILGFSICCLPVAAGFAGIVGIIAVFSYKYSIYLLPFGIILFAVSLFLILKQRKCQIKKRK